MKRKSLFRAPTGGNKQLWLHFHTSGLQSNVFSPNTSLSASVMLVNMQHSCLCHHLHLGGQQHSSTQVPFSWLLIRILLHISNSSPSHVMCWELHFRPISTASCRPVCSLMHINYLLGDDWFHFSVNRTAWGVINTSIKGLFQEQSQSYLHEGANLFLRPTFLLAAVSSADEKVNIRSLCPFSNINEYNSLAIYPDLFSGCQK